MASTSGTFNFQSIQVELIIREAFERIGLLGEFVEPQKLESAKRSIDFMLLEWMNRGVNLWTLQSSFLPLVTNQKQYTLPVTVSDVIQANLRTSTRVLDGVAASSDGGVAANAFDDNPTTACVQTAANGNISYDYGAGITQQINFVGIQSNVERNYTILIEGSANNADWSLLASVPLQSYQAGVTVWLDIPTPTSTRAYRIRETGGGTLNIREIYFNNNVLDYQISGVSRYEYFTYPNKQLQSRPNIYYLDRGIIPLLNLWPVPTSQYNCLQYTYKKMMEDVGGLYTNAVQVPSIFYPALVAGLTYYLAIKYNPQTAQAFKAEYNEQLTLAEIEDTERTPISITGDWNAGCY